MADTKISALTAATTPLAGSEVLPIVQSGTTKKVSVDNLTTGKTVQMAQSNIGFDGGQYVNQIGVSSLVPFNIQYKWTGGGNIYYATKVISDGGKWIVQTAPSATVGAHVFADAFRVTQAGNVEIPVAGKGVTVTSPDGLVTKTITIDNSGALVLI